MMATKELSSLVAAIKRRGFCVNDLPFRNRAISPKWEDFPIILALREAEKETGLTWQQAKTRTERG